MKSFNRAVDRFCYRHPRFGIPNLMLLVVIGSAVVYIISRWTGRAHLPRI